MDAERPFSSALAALRAPAGPAPEATIWEHINGERPRSLRMQYRFVRSLVFAFWLFSRLLLWELYIARWLPGLAARTQIRRWRGHARGFRRFAIGMGGVMIKLGQFASTRADVLPEEVIAELESLQDEVPAVPFERIRTVIEEELGPLAQRYRRINEDAVASASLGQVYRAQLLNGERVVIKVQRPGMRQIVYTDLAALHIVAQVAARFRFVSRRADPVGLAEEFGRVLLEEISYEQEARNAQRFVRMFEDDMNIYVPSVYPEHSTDRVLTMEDVTSIKINDFAALEAAGISRKLVARRLMQTYLRQIFQERFFHADPHPGNLFIYPLPVDDEAEYAGTGKRPFYLIFIDFGMTGTLSREIVQGMLNTLAAVISRDAGKMVRSYSELGFLLPDADTRRIEEAVGAVFDRVWGLSMAEMRDMDFEVAAGIAGEFNDLLHDMPFRVPQDFIYLGRAVGILSGMCTTLDPDYNPWFEIQRSMQGILSRQNGSTPELGNALANPLFELFAAGPRAFFHTLEGVVTPQTARTRELVQQIAQGELTLVTSLSPADRRRLDRLETQSRRTTRAVIFGSFLVSGTLLYTGGALLPALLAYAVAGGSFVLLLLARPSSSS